MYGYVNAVGQLVVVQTIETLDVYAIGKFVMVNAGGQAGPVVTLHRSGIRVGFSMPELGSSDITWVEPSHRFNAFAQHAVGDLWPGNVDGCYWTRLSWKSTRITKQDDSRSTSNREGGQGCMAFSHAARSTPNLLKAQILERKEVKPTWRRHCLPS